MSILLMQSFPQGVYLADGDFSELEGVIFGAPIEMTNKYLNAVAYYEVRFEGTTGYYSDRVLYLLEHLPCEEILYSL